jgi:beta-ribofuranosylaminobenzene 5'-phosphate synthase
MGFRVIARPRIHMGLVDLAGVSARSFCGVGFSISGPSTSWHVENSEDISLSGISHLDDFALDDIRRIVEILRARGVGGFSATLETLPLQHIGLGTKTSLLLSLISAINGLKGLNLSKSQIQQISGRGGASGVGINLFFCGGVVWDGGHPAPKELQFMPSSASKTTQAPPLLARWPFPDHWLVALALPDTETFSGEKELAFFKSKTPISVDQVLQTMSNVYHGIIPAVATADIGLLKIALENVHSVGLKREELKVQSSKTVEALEKMQTLPRVAAGLSSLGPLLYCIFDKRDEESQTLLEAMSRQMGTEYLGAFSGCNTGFTVEAI